MVQHSSPMILSINHHNVQGHLTPLCPIPSSGLHATKVPPLAYQVDHYYHYHHHCNHHHHHDQKGEGGWEPKGGAVASRLPLLHWARGEGDGGCDQVDWLYQNQIIISSLSYHHHHHPVVITSCHHIPSEEKVSILTAFTDRSFLSFPLSLSSKF